jgi:hypothetical protein
MLTFGDGLKIAFWNVKKQRTVGVIRFKTTLTPDAYIVDTVESGSCMVYEHQIIQVRMRDMVGDDIWVNIDDIYASFPNGAVITPLTKYNTSLDVVTIDPPGTTSLKVHLSPIRSDTILNYGIRDEEVTKLTMLEWKLIPKKVIFNGPATVVMWQDGTKTVVKKTEDDTDDREKAVMFAIIKKACGSRAKMNRYLKSFKEDKSNEEKKEEASSSELCQCEQGAGEGSSESTV